MSSPTPEQATQAGGNKVDDGGARRLVKGSSPSSERRRTTPSGTSGYSIVTHLLKKMIKSLSILSWGKRSSAGDVTPYS